MNKEMMKRNVSSHVLLQPPAYRLDHNGFAVKAVEDDWWLVQEVTDEGVTISDPRTGHFRLLGYDHIHRFTSDGVKQGAKRGFLTLLASNYMFRATMCVYCRHGQVSRFRRRIRS
jgi:hypothetical protein